MGGGRWSRVLLWELLSRRGIDGQVEGEVYCRIFFVDVVIWGFRDLPLADDVPQL